MRSTSRRPLLASVLTSVLAASVLAVTTLAAPADGAPPSSAPPRAHVWLTTPDGTHRLSDEGAVPFERKAAPAGVPTVTVDPSRTYQTMDGFGASLTDSSAHVLSTLSPAKRAATMQRLFSPTQGVGLSVLRQPMGASDFVEGDLYTYDDVPAGQTDYALGHFSIDHDKAQILPLLREALAQNPAIKVVATPWSPPAWMKTNQSLIGGKLIDEPRVYQAYADYFVKFVQAYRAEGVPVWALTLQNEPQNRNPRGYPGMDMPVAQQAKLVEALGPALRRAGLETKLLGYDHNWSEHPDDVASTPAGQDPETEYPADLLRSPASRWLAGTAYHCYAGDPSRMTELHRMFPDKGIWFTECSGSHGPTDPPAQVFSDTLKWHTRNLVMGVTRNWAQTVVNWNLALDPQGGPHHEGCDTCTGVVTVGPGDQVTENAELHTLGHLAKFVRPGAQRIASTSFGTTGWNGQVMSTAFRNPDGSTALLLHNENDDPRPIRVAQGDRSFEYTLPGGSLATFTWPASRALDDGFRLLPVESMTSSAPAAVDDDATTSWSGDSLTVDLGRTTPVRRVVLDSGTALTAYPRGVELWASRDGRTWRRLATAAGDGQLTVLDARTSARHLRVVRTATSPEPWSVADLRVYR